VNTIDVGDVVAGGAAERICSFAPVRSRT
jgi:hypothetical protein